MHDGKGYRQPQAQTVAHRFGREERVEHLIQVLVGDAAAVIHNAEAPQLLVGFQTNFQTFADFALHRIQRIAQQIDQHLFETNRITAHPRRARQVQDQTDLLITQPRIEQL